MSKQKEKRKQNKNELPIIVVTNDIKFFVKCHEKQHQIKRDVYMTIG